MRPLPRSSASRIPRRWLRLRNARETRWRRGAARTKLRLLEEAARPVPQETAVPMTAEDRAARARDCCAAPKGSSPIAILMPRRPPSRKPASHGPSSRPTLTRSIPRSCSSSKRRATPCARRLPSGSRSAPPKQERASALAREQADRVAICEEIEALAGPEAADRIAELKVQWDGLPPMPSEYAASLNRRFQDACRAFEDPRAAAPAGATRRSGRLETLATELEQLVASDQPLEEIIARWRGLRRDADVLREHASANPAAGERLERAVATLEEKEHQHQQVRAKQEQDNLRRLQQVCRQVETLAAAEQITLKAGDRALRDIRAALEERVPLPSKKDRQDIQARLEAARAALGPRVQELRDADEWQRWANLQVQEELCREMEALKAEENLEDAEPPHARAAGALEAGGARAACAGRGDVAPVQGGAGRGVRAHVRAFRGAERGASRQPGAQAGALRARGGAGRFDATG